MPGDGWQKAATLRLLYGYMVGHPGKKLLFMGCEFGQWTEWNYDSSLDWHVLEYPFHQGIQRCVQDLLHLYRSQPALYERDFDPSGFQWIDCTDNENSVISLLRRAADPADHIVMVLNFTPVVRSDYRVGVPQRGAYTEVFNSDAGLYGGSDVGNAGSALTELVPAHGFDQSLLLTLPPLGCLAFKPVKDAAPDVLRKP
jgi:1,4-alpha-glucan branching enzyme